MKKLATISMAALCATVAVVGVTGAVQLAATTPPLVLSDGNSAPGVNRAEKGDRLVATRVSLDVARSDKSDREASATATQITQRSYTVESFGSRPEEGLSEKSNMERISSGAPSLAEADGREDRLPGDQVQEPAAPSWDGTTGLAIQPVADTREASKNFAADTLDPDWTYSQGLADRTGRRVVYLWDLLKGSIGVH